MNEVFRSYLRKFVLVFFYDIIIYTKTWDEHLKNLEETLSLLEKKTNKKNNSLQTCQNIPFRKEEIDYPPFFCQRNEREEFINYF